MPVTQQDIAEKLGVSRRLVSYALNGEDGVGPQMRARILTIADELGYQTNRAAKALVTGRTNQVALCLPTLSLPFHAQFIHYFETLIRDTNYDLLVTTFGNSQPLPTVDGVLIHDARPMNNLSRPAVLIQSPPMAVYTTPANGIKIDQIYLDLEDASQAMMKHLLEIGKPRIAHVTWITTPDEPRLRAYRSAMKKAGLQAEIITMEYQPADMRSLAHQTLEEHFAQHGFPDALFCCNDEIAIGAYRALRKAGRKIPEETVVVGCDDIPETQDLAPALTTIKYAWDDICRCAWELLLKRIENPDAQPQHKSFASELVIRDSSTLRPI